MTHQTSLDQDLRTALDGLSASHIHQSMGNGFEVVGWKISSVDGFKGLAFMQRVDAALRAAPPRPVDAERVEDIFGDFDEANYRPDFASAVAAEILGLTWTHSTAEGEEGASEQMYRHGDVQEAVNRVLAATRVQTHQIPHAAHSPDKAVTREGVDVWHTKEKLPDVGRKFIALWDDGSGAALLYRHDDGFIDSDGDDYPQMNKSLDRWAYLPTGFEFHCELASEPGEPPMHLPEATATPETQKPETGESALGPLEQEGRT